MPKQSRRIASRQAQLAGRSKKKGRPRRAQPPPARVSPAPEPRQEARPTPGPERRAPAPSPRPAGPPPTLRTELTRIGLVTGILLVLLGLAVLLLR